MTFLEALNWMSESEENVAVGSGEKYKMYLGELYVEHHDVWGRCTSAFCFLMDKSWRKSEPEGVEVVAYLSKVTGAIYLAHPEKDDFKNRPEYREVKVRFT